jgi:sec-independent protein translocase protein TatC
VTDVTGGHMTLIEHLAELRRRIIVSIVAVAIGGVIVFVLWTPILEFLSGPYRDITDKELIVTGVAEGFAVRLQVATYGGILLAAPVIMFQLWRFITPALHKKEKRYAIPFVIATVVLFVFGAVVAWFTVEPAVSFLLTAGGDQVEPFVTARSYITLVTLMALAFGIAFEFPVVLMFALLARIVTTRQLRRARRYVIMGITVFAAVITPSQDPYSLFLMMVPMYLFYEGTILLGRIMKR